MGRGADYILRDREDVLNVFLLRDLQVTSRECHDTHGDRLEEAEQRVCQADASRESYYHYLTRAKWGTPRHHLSSLETPAPLQRGGADLIVHTN